MPLENTDLDAAILTSMFCDEERYGIRPNVILAEGEVLDEDADYESIFPDGSPAVFCSGYAGYVRRMLGDRALIHGYDCGENPQSSIALEAGGHDFAVVDGRYIVDFWAHDMGYTTSTVIDTEDLSVAEEVLRLYGPRETWTVNEGLQGHIDRETPEQRAEAMEGVDLAPREPGYALTPEAKPCC